MDSDHGHRGTSPRYTRLTEPAALQLMRSAFRRMNRWMVLLWRIGLGRMAGVWPGGFGRLLVIEHTGRRSGRGYRTPVNYTVVGDDLFCVAAFGKRTDWYRNVLAAPDIAVWLPDGRWTATASDASHDPQRIELMRRVLIDSGFAAPLFGLHPRRMSDAELAASTASYRLVRLRPVRTQKGTSGPGGLAWLWLPVAAGLAWRMARRLRGSR